MKNIFKSKIKSLIADILLINISFISTCILIHHYYFAWYVILILSRITLYKLFLINKQIWKYINNNDLVSLIYSIFIPSALFTILNIFLKQVNLNFSLPFSFFFIEFAFTSILLIFARLFRKHIFEFKYKELNQDNSNYKKTLLIGAGEAGQQILREIYVNTDMNLKVIGFLDDDDSKKESLILNVPVLGKINDLKNVAEKFAVELVIVCIPSANIELTNKIITLCSINKIPTKIVPSLNEIINGNVSIHQIKKVEISDLLARNEIKFDFTSIEYLQGKTVFVTGAGGSIGSEICRQILKLKLQELVLIGRGENSIYLIHEELSQKYPDIKISPVIADIRNKIRMEHIFNKYNPDIVFHAAAHKHVPLMEYHPSEAILNNIIGTQNIAELSSKYKVKNFILISTDKAINSTNVMGASKRVAELIIQDFSRKSEYTKFVAVRFGNVLSSRGSVIPKFEKQIAAGGPVTVTHPEMERYFMTIPEASQLVIKAGSLGTGGEIFILNMDKPVKIVDLAKKMIILSGKLPNVDIDIKFTGLRPGEKLHEELFNYSEDFEKTESEKIFVVKSPAFDSEFLHQNILKLQENAIINNDEEIRNILMNNLNALKEQNLVNL